VRLAIYGKAGCCLCDNAEEVVRYLRREYTFEMERVDITHDLGLYDRYREAIPVLTLDGVEIARGRVAIAAVRTAFVKAARSVQI